MPATTPELRIPYPLPADSVADYPGVGLDLAETLETLIGDGLHLLWDSLDAGAVLPAVSITTPPLPQTAKHLLISWQGRSDRNAQLSDVLGLRLNATATAYYDQQVIAAAAAVAASAGLNSTSMRVGQAAGATARAQCVGAGLILIPNYARPDNFPVAYAFGGQAGDVAAGQTWVGLWAGWLGSIQAVSTVTLLSASGWNLQGGGLTRMTVYGL